MKIAHLSDLHFTTFFRKDNLEKIEYLLKYALRNKFDHLVISGDLTHNADPEDFEILRDLLKRYNLLSSDRLSLVIGNHDIFGGPQTAEDVFLFPEKCKLVDYDKKIKEFGDYFSEAFQYCSDINGDNFFPYVKKFHDVIIFGLNSIAKYSKINNPFASNEKINKDDFNFLATKLEKYYIDQAKKLIIIHHHFNKIKVVKNPSASSFWQNIEKQTMKLKKKKKLFQLFSLFGVDLVLHGHIHESNEYIRKGTRFLNAGASVLGTEPVELKINFVNIKNSCIDTQIHKILHAEAVVSELKYEEPESKLFSIVN
ncbi:MAG: metallophosphoesterase [Ignavibacteriaceae bacterium]